MIVLSLATTTVALGIALAVFIDWGGPRRIIRCAQLHTRQPAAPTPTVAPKLADDLAARVKELH